MKKIDVKTFHAEMQRRYPKILAKLGDISTETIVGGGGSNGVLGDGGSAGIDGGTRA